MSKHNPRRRFVIIFGARSAALVFLIFTSDKMRLSDAIRNPRCPSRVICVHWADRPKNPNPGVGFSRLNGGLGSRLIGGLPLAAPTGRDAASFAAINRDKICSRRHRGNPAAVVHWGSARISPGESGVFGEGAWRR